MVSADTYQSVGPGVWGGWLCNSISSVLEKKKKKATKDKTESVIVFKSVV